MSRHVFLCRDYSHLLYTYRCNKIIVRLVCANPANSGIVQGLLLLDGCQKLHFLKRLRKGPWKPLKTKIALTLLSFLGGCQAFAEWNNDCCHSIRSTQSVPGQFWAHTRTHLCKLWNLSMHKHNKLINAGHWIIKIVWYNNLNISLFKSLQAFINTVSNYYLCKK